MQPHSLWLCPLAHCGIEECRCAWGKGKGWQFSDLSEKARTMPEDADSPQAAPPVCCVTVKKPPNLSGPFLHLEKGLIRDSFHFSWLAIKQPLTAHVLGPVLDWALG